jgi:hypothetical protein
MPCYDVQRFREENQIAEAQASDGLDRAKGTIEQIADIQPCTWNKYWRKTYEYEFSKDRSDTSVEDNFKKFRGFLQNRLGAWRSSMEQVFMMQRMEKQEDTKSCKLRLPWINFDEQALPGRTQRPTAWMNTQAKWETAYHGTRLGLSATIHDGRLVKGPSRKLKKSGIFCFSQDRIDKAHSYAIWVPLFVDGLLLAGHMGTAS